ncbi:MAG: hypothetical protein GF416_05450 [Candidatus Altiarchaeales archaeon]|nr:hypothetical protein [Candidatus Altiarchaeales archaeon]MBD3416563.1 hypothetical protein [Candidatus Altiarchaeales archaeon]
MRRGYLVTLDAIISLSFILFLMLGFIGIQYFEYVGRGGSSFEHLHSVAENAIDTVNKKGVLEEIGRQWALGNMSYAGNLTEEHFGSLIPGHVGYRLEAVDSNGVHVIYASGPERPGEDRSEDVTRAVRLLSGYKEGSPRAGWAARAWLVENMSWITNLVSNESVCCEAWEEVMLEYSPGDEQNNAFFIMIPGDRSLSGAELNVSWVYGSTSTTTSSTTTSSSTTSTTLGGCHECPGTECPIPGWYGTSGDDYNYHQFTTDRECDLEVIIYTGLANNQFGTNLYDLYANWEENMAAPGCGGPCSGDGVFYPDCLCKCAHPMSDPQLWPWECNTLIDGGLDTYRSCIVPELPAGTYQLMVDCWSPGDIVNLCPGDYYIYIQSTTPGCPNYQPPGTSTTVTTTSTTDTTTTSTTIPLLANGERCTEHGECQSGNCAVDYDMPPGDDCSTSEDCWCAPAGNCAHSDVATCDQSCYEDYYFDMKAPVCRSDTGVWRCVGARWTEDFCPVCGSSGNPIDIPCIGMWECQAGSPYATCDAGCTKDGDVCDYCGGGTSQPDSDSWFNAVCFEGSCRCDMDGVLPVDENCAGARYDCDLCTSCYIQNMGFDCLLAGGDMCCDPRMGRNDYRDEVQDIIGPNTCTADFCDGAGNCVMEPQVGCSSRPKKIYYEYRGWDSCPPSQWDYDCMDDGTPDGNNTRLSHRRYTPGLTYASTYGTHEGGGWYCYPEEVWSYTKGDDDDVSIGKYEAGCNPFQTSQYVKHGESVRFSMDIESGVTDIRFKFSAMPQASCLETLQLLDDTGTNTIGTCVIGEPSKGPGSCPAVQMDNSMWDYCEVQVDSGDPEWSYITLGAENIFTIRYDYAFDGYGGGCSTNTPCVMYLDSVEMECS